MATASSGQLVNPVAFRHFCHYSIPLCLCLISTLSVLEDDFTLYFLEKFEGTRWKFWFFSISKISFYEFFSSLFCFTSSFPFSKTEFLYSETSLSLSVFPSLTDYFRFNYNPDQIPFRLKTNQQNLSLTLLLLKLCAILIASKPLRMLVCT